MIRCPNCGSTAQVREIPKADVNTNTVSYKCGCGCHFEVETIVRVKK